MKRILFSIFGAVSFVVVIYLFANYYSVIFATSISGRIIGVQKVNEASMIGMGGAIPSAQIFSFSVAIRSESGEIFTGSTEDRQWAVTKDGMCVRARFFPYPFWDLQKSGTYFNVRMLQMFDCPAGYAEAPGASAVAPVAPTATPTNTVPLTAPSATPTPNNSAEKTKSSSKK